MYLLRKVAHGVRTVGPRYLVRAIPNEFARPRLALTHSVRAFLTRWGDRLSRKAPRTATGSSDCLQFVYDLTAGPVTFDFASYLAAAEIERRRRGLRGINVLFVPGRHGGLRPEMPHYEAVVDPPSRLWRVRHILVPMLAFLPSLRGYTLCSTREEAAALLADDGMGLYPPDYRVFLPRQPNPADIRDHARAGIPIWPMFRATDHGRRLAAEFLRSQAGDRFPIVITLRDSRHIPERN